MTTKKETFEQELESWRKTFANHFLFQDPRQPGVWSFGKPREILSPWEGLSVERTKTLPARSLDGPIDYQAELGGGYRPDDITSASRMEIVLVRSQSTIIFYGDHGLAPFKHHSTRENVDPLISYLEWVYHFIQSPSYGAEKFSLGYGGKDQDHYFDIDLAHEQCGEWLAGMERVLKMAEDGEAANRAAAESLDEDSSGDDEDLDEDSSGHDDDYRARWSDEDNQLYDDADALDRDFDFPGDIGAALSKIESMRYEMNQTFSRDSFFMWLSEYQDCSEVSFGSKIPWQVSMAAAIAERILKLKGIK